MNPVLAAVIGVAVGYLVGAIPFGVLVGRFAGVEDVRAYGSGKTGFTNSLRTLGMKWALLVMVADVTKGSLAVLFGRLVLDEPLAAALAGAAAVIGHIFPIYVGFRGGRGVSTAFGALFAVSPPAGLVVATFAAIILAVFRYASLMSVLGVFVGFLAVVGLVLTDHLAAEYLAFGALTLLAVELSHLGNIRRLLAGTEPKLGQGGDRRATGAH